MVFKRFIQFAEAKVTEAQTHAQQQLFETIDDLETLFLRSFETMPP